MWVACCPLSEWRELDITGVPEDKGAGDMSHGTTFTRPLSARCENGASRNDMGKQSAVQEE
jgi:hypothetical protein